MTMSPATVKRTEVFVSSSRHFCLILIKAYFCRHIYVKSPVSKFMEIRAVGAALIHAEKWTGMKLIVTQ
jgi:hypothetical protein